MSNENYTHRDYPMNSSAPQLVSEISGSNTSRSRSWPLNLSHSGTGYFAPEAGSFASGTGRQPVHSGCGFPHSELLSTLYLNQLSAAYSAGWQSIASQIEQQKQENKKHQAIVQENEHLKQALTQTQEKNKALAQQNQELQQTLAQEKHDHEVLKTKVQSNDEQKAPSLLIKLQRSCNPKRKRPQTGAPSSNQPRFFDQNTKKFKSDTLSTPLDEIRPPSEPCPT